jgi:serine protease AprX
MISVSRYGWRQVLAGLVLALASAASLAAAPAGQHPGPGKLSAKVRERATTKRNAATVDVLVRFRKAPGASERTLLQAHGGRLGRRLRVSSRWMAVRLPLTAVTRLAENPAVEFVASDERVSAAMDVARQAVNAPGPTAPESLLKGAGVTIAVLDSGIAPHADIQTLIAAVDFVGNPNPTPVVDLPDDPTRAETASIDPNGHGTHVAGILVGSGSHSFEGRLAGIAPAASLVSVRVLDEAGSGRTSDVLAGLQWVLDHKDDLGIRVLNLSLGHPVYEPAALDPLVQEVEALWSAGIVVVCSAGNAGRTGDGTISSPCNSREVISVGASNAWKTPDTADDTVATYSSRGPTLIDHVAKPDLLAPGNRTVSARALGSYLDLLAPDRRVAGDPAFPEVTEYFELSGTSMAAPMVAGTAALMLEQEPSLNPGTVKARLMLSARKPAVGSPLVTGAGVLDVTAALHATGQVADAPSPLVSQDTATGELVFENTAALWSEPSFSLPALWSDAVLWSESTSGDDPLLRSYGVRVPDATVSPYATLWAEATLWADATLWTEATLWADATLWAEATLWADATLWTESQARLVDDP